MAKNYPKHFASFNEYDAYCTCLEKARAGDLVDIYYRINHPSKVIEPTVKRATVIGKKYVAIAGYEDNPGSKFWLALLLGTNREDMGFWRVDHRETNGATTVNGTAIKEYDKKLLMSFNRGYWAYSDDIRIAKVIFVNH